MRKELRQALEQVAGRFRQARLWTTLALCWLAWAVVGLGLYLALTYGRAAWVPRNGIYAALALAAITAIALAVAALRSARDPRWVARRIEAKYPDLSTALLSAVEEDAVSPPGRLGFLQTAVLREALNHRAVNDWSQNRVDLVAPRHEMGAWGGALSLRRGIGTAPGGGSFERPHRRSGAANFGRPGERRQGRARQYRARARHVAFGRRAASRAACPPPPISLSTRANRPRGGR